MKCGECYWRDGKVCKCPYCRYRGMKLPDEFEDCESWAMGKRKDDVSEKTGSKSREIQYIQRPI